MEYVAETYKCPRCGSALIDYAREGVDLVACSECGNAIDARTLENCRHEDRHAESGWRFFLKRLFIQCLCTLFIGACILFFCFSKSIYGESSWGMLKDPAFWLLIVSVAAINAVFVEIKNCEIRLLKKHIDRLRDKTKIWMAETADWRKKHLSKK